MSLPRYEAYKDSGVEWIGEIPEGWEVKRLKYVGEALIGITYSPNEVSTESSGTLVLRSSNVQNGELSFDDCVYVDKKIQEKDYTKEGDILICARNGSAHLVGKCAYVDRANAGHTFGAFMSIVRSQFGRYLYHFFSSEIFKSQTGLFSTSTINQLTSDTLNNLRIALPNTTDQVSITAFLDRKTAEIDQLIANKEKLIALYEEEKTAIINRAVTRGLPSTGSGQVPQVTLKPSGVDWLGDIPEHWEVKRLKYLTTVLNDGTHGSFKRTALGYRLLSVRNIVNNEFLFLDDDSRVSEEDFDIITKPFLVAAGDLQLAIVGATLGKVAIVPELDEKFATQRSVATIRAKQELIQNKYIFYFLKCSAFQNFLWLNAGFSAQPGIYLGSLSNCHIPTPDLAEQAAIVTHIEAECTRLDAIIDKFKKQIELFKEYRTTLISEVVTGKIDVRGEVGV